MSPQKRRNLGRVMSVRLEPDVLKRLEELRRSLDADRVMGPAGPWTPSSVLRYAVTVGVDAVEERLGVGKRGAGSK